MLSFHQNLYKYADKQYQDQFLLRHMQISTVKRHRITSERYNRVDCTTKYFIGKSKMPVCLKTFLLITGVSRFRLNRISKVAHKENPIQENLGGFRKSEYFKNQWKIVSDFLNRLEYSESHYC